ncbi:MAG: tetratricopeptide repeat protein [Planctomycetes bacterium]|nr:tetratricopeptide repeat protein [Planctomycetota bacterium]
MRALAVGLCVVIGTICLCIFGGGFSVEPRPPQSVEPECRAAFPTLEAKHTGEAPQALPLVSESRKMASDLRVQEFQRNLKVADALVRNAVRPEQHLDAQLNRAILYDAQGRHEEANAALLHAGDVSASEAAATSAKNPASPQPTPEHAAALTVLSHAHREMVRKEFASARRHLNLVVDRYAETAPIVVQQALSDLQWIATQEGSAIHAPETAVPAAAAGKRDAGESSCNQKFIVPATADGGVIIFSGAQAGHSYFITASGVWAQDPDPSFNCGPNGFTGFGPINGGDFSGMLFGTFAVREPGSASWVAVGTSGTVTATADGPIFGAFADIAFAYNDNNGAMLVAVTDTECPPPPPVETLPPTAVCLASPDIVCVEMEAVSLDGSLSIDNDTEGEEPSIAWYNWNFKNLSNLSQRAIIVEGPQSSGILYPDVPGEYRLALTVTDNEGELASTETLVKVVHATFDPEQLEIEAENSSTAILTIIPESAYNDIVLTISEETVATVQSVTREGGVAVVEVAGVSQGTTVLSASTEGSSTVCATMEVKVVPATAEPTRPVAVINVVAPVIAVGGRLQLLGNLSHDTDTINDELKPPITEYRWLVKQVEPEHIAPIRAVTNEPELRVPLVNAGRYIASLIVGDNDDQSSVRVEVAVEVLDIHISVNPTDIAIGLAEGRSIKVTLSPKPESGARASIVQRSTDGGQVSLSDSVIDLSKGTNSFLVQGSQPGSVNVEISLQGISGCQAELSIYVLEEGQIAIIPKRGVTSVDSKLKYNAVKSIAGKVRPASGNWTVLSPLRTYGSTSGNSLVVSGLSPTIEPQANVFIDDPATGTSMQDASATHLALRVIIDVNKTPSQVDDGLKVPNAIPGRNYTMECSARLLGSDQEETFLLLTNDKCLNFPNRGAHQMFIRMPPHGETAEFSISAVKPSSKDNATLIQAIHASTGKKCGEEDITSYSVDGKLRLKSNSTYILSEGDGESLNYVPSQPPAVMFDGSGTFLPEDYSCSDDLAQSLKVGFVQNVQSSKATVLYSDPAIGWINVESIPPNFSISIPASISLTASRESPINDTGPEDDPLYSKFPEALKPFSPCNGSDGKIHSDDSPNLTRIRPSLSKSVVLDDGTIIGIITYGLDRVVLDHKFKTWLVAFNAASEEIDSVIREAGWSLSTSSDSKGRKAKTGSDSAASDIPLSGPPYANDPKEPTQVESDNKVTIHYSE